MGRHFHSILVPVDFTMNTQVAISKALELAREDSTVHLFNVLQRGLHQRVRHFFTGFTRKQINREMLDATRRMNELKDALEKEGRGIKFLTSVCDGDSVQDAVVRKAMRISAGLVVIGKHSHHSRFPFLNTVVPNEIAGATGIPVLTAKPGSLHTPIRTVVMPVGIRFPSSKLELLEALRAVSALQVKLVVFLEEEADAAFSKQSLLNTFRTLKSYSTNPVNYEVLKGRNKAKALLAYCREVGADVLVVHPGAETRVGVWTNSHIADVLPASSKTQVLAVTPG